MPETPAPLGSNYVTKRMVLVIHRLCLNLTGGYGTDGVNLRAGQGLGFVDYVFANEVFGQRIYPDIFHQAAAYMFHIIKGHIFTDGNKRTGLAVAITFLEWNGILFAPLPDEAVFDFVMALAGGPNDPDEAIPRIASWLRGLSET